MKICVLSHNLNPETGIGEFVINLVKEAQVLLPQADFTLMTDGDILKPGFASIINNWAEIRRKIRESDMIHAMDAYPYGFVAAVANIFINRPLIITAIGTGSTQSLGGFGLKSLLLRWVYSRSSVITAISGYVARKIEKHIKKKVSIINPGIDYDYWSTAEDLPIDQKLESLGPYLLSVGEFKRRKGYDVMLPIINDVLKANAGVKYVIVANMTRNAKYRDELKAQIKDLGMEETVTIMSGLSREYLRAVFQHAYLYVTLPQKVNGDIEGFGLAILQAAAAGLPALVGSGSGADDAIRDGVGGFLMPQDDKALIERKINEIISDKELHSRLSAGAREFARSMGWREQTKGYVEIYQRLKQ